MIRISKLLLVLAITCCIISSCTKKKSEAPVLPPSSSMTMDFSYFTTTKSDNKGVETTFFDAAVAIVENWIPITETSLAVPISAFEALASNENSLQSIDDDTWEWNYSVDGNNVVVTAVVGSNVKWNVNVGGIDYITGSSDVKGTSGYWEIKENSSSSSPLLKAEWASAQSKITALSYTCMSGSYSGSTINYTPSATSSTYKNAFDGKDGNNTFFIEWEPTIGGRIKSQANFGNTDWHNWNANKNNVLE